MICLISNVPRRSQDGDNGYLNRRRPYMDTISKEELKARLSRDKPNNYDKRRGFTLVNVLSQEDFNREHIPGSMNIPIGQESQFEQLFDNSKEIYVYCASRDCPASRKVADELSRRGFRHVAAFEGGMKEWKQGGDRVEGIGATIHELRL